MPDPTPTPAAPTPTAPATPPEGKPQEQPETDWKAKFEAQQQVNRDLEGKFNGLRDEQSATREALAKALGLTPEQGVPDVSVLAATVETLQTQFTKTQHDNLVLSVAAASNITDPKRLETLSKITDEATLREVAAQFAQPAGTGNPITQPGPRPDLTQGAAGTPATGTPEQDFANFLGGQMAGRG